MERLDVYRAQLIRAIHNADPTQLPENPKEQSGIDHEERFVVLQRNNDALPEDNINLERVSVDFEPAENDSEKVAS